MPDLYLHNSLTRRKERFEPADPAHVRMYVCGPTVYDLAHLGNGRPVVVFDVVARLLRRLYPLVTYVRNITDVDDRINARAIESGESIGAITARTTADFHTDMAALGNLPPDQEPRATAHIAEMIMIIERLIASGHAYAAEGHVLFAVASDIDYGKLSGRSQDELLAGARVDVAPYKRDPAISSCGSRPRMTCQAGTARGVAAGPAGISNAPPCPGSIWEKLSTSTAAAAT